MATFDYIHAWYAAAKPAYEECMRNPHAARLAGIVDNHPELQQDSALNVPSPGEEFDGIVAQMSTIDLAHLSCASHDYGHWSPHGHTSPHGSTWKLANILDQAISARLGMRPPHSSDSGDGFSFRCLEGCIRICLSTKDSWTCEEIDFASEALWKAINDDAGNRPVKSTKESRMDYCIRGEKYMHDFVATHRADSEPWAGLLNTKRFMVEEADEYHLRTVQPDGTAKEGMCGMSADLAVSIQCMRDYKNQPPAGTIRMLGKGGTWRDKGKEFAVEFAEVVGDPSISQLDAVKLAETYKSQRTVREAEESLAKAKAHLETVQNR